MKRTNLERLRSIMTPITKEQHLCIKDGAYTIETNAVGVSSVHPTKLICMGCQANNDLGGNLKEACVYYKVTNKQ